MFAVHLKSQPGCFGISRLSRQNVSVIVFVTHLSAHAPAAERLANFVVRIGNQRPDASSIVNGNVGASNAICVTQVAPLPGGPTILVCSTPLTGRFLSVQLMDTNFLTLCEVVVGEY
jgi:hypothetical protein